jgi:hypothetical protein
VVGDMAYLNTLWNDLSLIDLADPASEPLMLDPAGRSGGALVVDEGYAYVVGGGGLRVWDLGASPPAAIGVYEMPGGDETLSVAGDTAYIGGELFSAFYTVDVSDPPSATWQGVYDYIKSAPMAHVIVGEKAYLADKGGLRVLDVSDPSAPVVSDFLGGLANGFGEGRDIVIVDGLAFIAEFPYCHWDEVPHECEWAGGGLRIVDLSTLSEIGYLNTPVEASAVAVSGDYAYLGARKDDTENGLYVVDVSDPSAPVEVGFYDTPGEPQAVDVDETRALAYVADGGEGLVVVDVSTPAAPEWVSTFNAGGANDVAVVGTKVYLGTGWMACILDGTDPSALDWLAATATGDVREIAVGDGGLFYAVAQGGGLFIIRYTPPVATVDATVRFVPGFLNLRHKLGYILAYVELPEGYDVAAIDPSTVLLDDTIAPLPYLSRVGDRDRDGIPDVRLLFRRRDVVNYLQDASGEVTLTLTGELEDGTLFVGSDAIRVLSCRPDWDDDGDDKDDDDDDERDDD